MKRSKLSQKLTPRPCEQCKKMFTRFNSTQIVCCVTCAQEYVKAKEVKKAGIDFNRETRRLKKTIKKKSKWIEDAQTAFNAFIRKRDEALPCISCGRAEVEWTRGGSWDCGHYKSRGACPELRFEELNAHKQCKSCNGGSAKYAKKGHTVGQDYTERLILKIGADKVDWLNGPHKEKKYEIDEIKEIEQLYKRKLKELKEGNV